MHKIITMSDSSYFPAGNLFLKTRDRVNADVTLYGPDLTKEQIKILSKRNIDYIKIDPEKFKTEMQYLKFEFLFEEINWDLNFNKYNGFTFMDWDTFIINDWKHIFEKYDFDFGITIREDQIKKKVLRAYTNGGVIFVKSSGFDLISFAIKIMQSGKNDKLKEYDEVWKTLETERPINKTYLRENLRWWCDQIFCSSIFLKNIKENGYHKIKFDPTIFKFENFKIAAFNCNHYNLINSKPKITNEKDVYIRHLKNIGRDILGLKKIKEKL